LLLKLYFYFLNYSCVVLFRDKIQHCFNCGFPFCPNHVLSHLSSFQRCDITGKLDSDTPAIIQTPIARIPPTTASGIVAMTAPTFVKRPRKMRMMPASCMVKRLATRVIDTTATFSEPTESRISRYHTIGKTQFVKSLRERGQWVHFVN
jgi:hypothetical protein